ncbi:MAG TPA: peptide ABC transporter substrate-binding protein [Oscillatoriales cyanobacterium M59_W2019_021]|nr:peptide ABC transporter substrate-binding protein [Oscillatoriales cyanobacterium M4454_W2019_049]HIK51419.1 peptide ABC transporter substrate-binding protein [Oscillatoriales cyanobacterium M59_W2019_021]
MKPKSFVRTDATETEIAPPPPTQQLLPLPTDNREYIKVILIGSPDAVTNTIQVLYRRGFARVWEWSPPQPTQKPGEVMSLLRRLVSLDSKL